jgi:hypothetical protein
VTDYTIEAPDGTTIAPKVADTPFLAKIRKLEASGDNQKSPKGAAGRFQITRPTADAFGIDYDKLSNAEYNEESAKKIAAKLQERFPGNEDAQVIAWNAGPGVAEKWLHDGMDEATLPKETQAYLDRAAAYGKTDGAGDYTVEPPEAPHTPAAKPKPESEPVAKPEDVASDLKKMRKTPLQLAEENLTAPVREGFRQGAEAQERLRKDVTPGPIKPSSSLGDVLKLGSDALGVAGGGFLSGLSKGAIGEPVSNTLKALTGGKVNLDPQMVGDVATLAIPGVGAAADEARLASRARSAGVGTEAIRANEAATVRGNTLKAAVTPERPSKAPATQAQAKHQEAASRLEAEGQYLTPGQREGGSKKVREDRAETGSTYTGPATQEARQKSSESFNRVGYNRALTEAGLPPVDTKAGPVGNEGLAALETKLHGTYDRALAKAQTERDPQLVHELDIVRQRAASLSRERRERLNDIIGNDLTLKFDQNGKMDGQTFKKVESELRRKARGYQGDPTSEERDLGKLVDDAANALRESVNRHSPPEVVRDLRKADTGWAVFKRLQRATAYAGHPDGVYTPKELRTAIRTKDTSLDKGAFARGDALLQDLARDGQTVLPNKVRDPGTAAQLKAGIAGRLIGGAVGSSLGAITHNPVIGELGAVAGYAAGEPIDAMVSGLTNRLARARLERGPPAVAPRNYLKAADRRAVSRSSPRIGQGQLPPP